MTWRTFDSAFEALACGAAIGCIVRYGFFDGGDTMLLLAILGVATATYSHVGRAKG